MSTTLTPYVSYPGTAREAFAFYERALGARIVAMMRYADVPAPVVAGEMDCTGGGSGPSGDGIMHACLVLPGGAMLMAGDAAPGMEGEGIHGIMLALQYDTVDEAASAFHALAEGGKVTMPLAPAFWAQTFGMVSDRFGVDWAVNGGPISIGS